MSKLYSHSRWMMGIIEDIAITRLCPPFRPLRSEKHFLGNLVDSIRQNGLLQPIVVRIREVQSYEIVAGWRRYNACKILGWRKMPCHVVQLNDKEAFEISLIENVQRNSLSPIEEGLAFKKYVQEFGWGGISDLAEKIGKSVSYIGKRIHLLDLPTNIIESIDNQTLSSSIAEELCQVRNKEKQSEIAEMIARRRLSLRRTRELIKEENSDVQWISHKKTLREIKSERAIKMINKTIILMRITMNRVANIIEDSEDDRQLHAVLMKHKNMLHEQIDELMREKRMLSRINSS